MFSDEHQDHVVGQQLTVESGHDHIYEQFASTEGCCHQLQDENQLDSAWTDTKTDSWEEKVKERIEELDRISG